MTDQLPDPALVVLAGAAGSGKSTWASRHFARGEIVSSDGLRAAVGTGPADLDATVDAFAVLDLVVAARLRRRLTTVIDTLGLDSARRAAYKDAGREAGVPTVLVIMHTQERLCRTRNAQRDRPVPAATITGQLRRVKALVTEAAAEGWDLIITVDQTTTPEAAPALPDRGGQRAGGVILQLSRFPWARADPASWLTDVVRTADEVGFTGVALMDHLIQIPQVDRAWEPIPEPYVTLGLLAGLDTQLTLGTLVSPATFRAPGIVAKSVATLDVLSGGRAFCGLGAGWFAREHAAFGLDFPPPPERLDLLEETIETLRALWGSGTRPYAGRRVSLPETTCYPRPVHDVPIIVGGSGDRTQRIAARLADACNLRTGETFVASLATFRRHCARAGREPKVTVLDVPVVGTDRDDVARRVERLRGRTPAATFAARHHAGTPDQHAGRYGDLVEQGVTTLFLALPDLDRADDLERCAPLVRALG